MFEAWYVICNILKIIVFSFFVERLPSEYLKLIECGVRPL